MFETEVVNCPKAVGIALNQILRKSNHQRILIVTGKSLYEASGADKELSYVLDDLQIELFRYTKSNPTIEDLIACIQFAKHVEPQTIIGIGGGTAMDIAKATRSFLANPGDFKKTIIEKIPFRNPTVQTLIQIPTTIGSGSEATQFAVVYISGKKYSIDHPSLRADYCLLDPQLTMSLPPEVIASSSLDALSQAIESTWSINSTPESLKFSYDALKIHKEHMQYVPSKINFEIMSKLLYASHLAGNAINITRTTACHALSYAFTFKYGIPHGHAVSLTIPPFLRFNNDVNESNVQDSRGFEFVKETMRTIAQTLGFPDVLECSHWFESLITKVGFSSKLRDLGILKENIESDIVSEFNIERGKNNPRRLSHGELNQILLEVW